MTYKVAINGFGRIGRNVLRLLASGTQSENLEIVAINDLTDAKTLAHLLKYDSVHGKAPFSVEVSDNKLRVGGKEILVTAEKDPSKLPWGSSRVDLVMECTGVFRKKEKAALHLTAGAKKVLISAPSPDPDITIAYGVNHNDYRKDEQHIVSCASCTTNCLAPVAKVIEEHFGTVRASMTTIHSYTNDQNILDLPHEDMRRARAAALSMIPTTTGAAKALGLVIPSLKGKVDGFAVRVPTADVSLCDYVVEVERDVTVEEANRAFRSASEGSLKGILGYIEEELVSVDFIGDRHSGIIDAQSTMVIGKKLLKAVAWYDNEIGFSNRMLDVATLMMK
jgi:glyceraldehyde 3-phosphate dehydrogenase